MGLFSGIKKVFKKVWSGIKKVFKPILKPISKFLNSKLGKAIMVGVMVFSMGSALLAGGKAFMGAQGFINKFVKGGQAFINDLLGTQFGEGAVGGGGKEATSLAQQSSAAQQAEGMQQAADMVQGGVDNVIPGTTDIAAQGVENVSQAGDLVSGGTLQKGADMTKTMAEGGALGPTKAMAKSGVPLDMVAKGAGAAEKGNWLKRAANAAADFAGKDADTVGGMLLGKTLQGVGDYYTLKDQQEFQDRVRRGFYDPNDAGYQALRNFDYSVDVPGNMAGGAMSQAVNNFNRPLNLPPVRFEPQT